MQTSTVLGAVCSYVACETHDTVDMLFAGAECSLCFGICEHAELAGLYGQRAISLAAAGLPLAAFLDNLTSVKVCQSL